jgi:radical SAM protein (TIGR01212 family)
MNRYNSFGPFIKSLFGKRVYKVNVDAGFTCPNRDGSVAYGGCIYCNNDSFRPSSCKPILPIKEQIRNGISYLRKRYGAEKFIVYFQPFSNTYAPVEELERLYTEAIEEDDVIGLAIGTRPDCVDEEKIRLLEDISKDYFVLIEYGLQSIYDKTLRFINRGHDYASFLRALDLTRERGIHIGAHTIVGFPTETEEEMLEMAHTISGLPIEFLKIHQLQIVRNTILERYYLEKPFHTFDYEEYIDFVVRFIERLSPSIVLQRLFATAPDDILIAPKWDRGRQELLRDIGKRFIELNTYQGRLYRPQPVRV